MVENPMKEGAENHLPRRDNTIISIAYMVRYRNHVSEIDVSGSMSAKSPPTAIFLHPPRENG